jgi:hypothetical protein
MAAADEREAPAHPVAAGYSPRLSGRRRGAAGGDEQVGIHLTGDILIEEGGDIAAVAADHRAPPDRALGRRQRLDDADLRQWVELRTAPSTRHRHAKDTGFFHRRSNRMRDSAARFDLVACPPNLLRKPDSGMQHRRGCRPYVARKIRHRLSLHCFAGDEVPSRAIIIQDLFLKTSISPGYDLCWPVRSAI